MNIYEIAEKAGVSIATVSRVLNNKGNISKKTYDKVMQVLQSKLARTLILLLLTPMLSGVSMLKIHSTSTNLINSRMKGAASREK